MLLAHTAAAAAVGLVLARGEAALWDLCAWLAPLAPSLLLTLLQLAAPPGTAGRRRPAAGCPDRPRLRRELSRLHRRRGPPGSWRPDHPLRPPARHRPRTGRPASHRRPPPPRAVRRTTPVRRGAPTDARRPAVPTTRTTRPTTTPPDDPPDDPVAPGRLHRPGGRPRAAARGRRLGARARQPRQHRRGGLRTADLPRAQRVQHRQHHPRRGHPPHRPPADLRRGAARAGVDGPGRRGGPAGPRRRGRRHDHQRSPHGHLDRRGGLRHRPRQFQQFPLSVGPLPDAGTTVLLPAVQTYSDGTEVSWDEPVPADGEEPEHPAPELVTTAAASDEHAGHGGPASAASTASTGGDAAAATGWGAGGWLGLTGAVLGAAGLVVALLGRRRAA